MWTIAWSRSPCSSWTRTQSDWESFACFVWRTRTKWVFRRAETLRRTWIIPNKWAIITWNLKWIFSNSSSSSSSRLYRRITESCTIVDKLRLISSHRPLRPCLPNRRPFRKHLSSPCSNRSFETPLNSQSWITKLSRNHNSNRRVKARWSTTSPVCPACWSFPRMARINCSPRSAPRIKRSGNSSSRPSTPCTWCYAFVYRKSTRVSSRSMRNCTIFHYSSIKW